MQNFKILNSKGAKFIYDLLEKQYGYTGKLDYAFLKNKDDVYIISRGLSKLDFKKLRISSLGLYFGEIKHDMLRLSIEASQLLGNKLGKNILTLNDEQARYWLIGDDLPISTDLKGHVIIKHDDDYIGCGYVKNNILLNHVPKERRMKEII